MIEDKLKKELNEQQYEAASWIKTSSLILAGAGSGKTRVLIYKVAKLIFGEGISPSQILTVTFTNKAANEMKSRIFDFSKSLGYNLGNNSLLRTGTFHSIFLKILKSDIQSLNMGYTSSFGVYDQQESLTLIKTISNNLGYKDIITPKEVKSVISNAKNSGQTPHKFLTLAQNENAEIIGRIYQEYQKQLVESNSVDFDDLLLLTKILFENNEDILEKYRQKFKYILVDEAQDTNQIQFDIIKMLAGKDGNVTFIGDDFQSIYSRRGAVMENFLNLERFWDNIQKFKLETNYRSSPTIVEAGNYLISKNKFQYEKQVKSSKENDSKIRSFCFKDEYDEAGQLSELIQKLINEKNLKFNDIAILYRTNAQSQPFEQALLSLGIPYKIWGGFKFFERKEIKDIISYIKYIINPKDSISLKRIINTPNRKIGATTIKNIENFCLENGYDLNYAIENIETLPIPITSGPKNNIKQFSTFIKFTRNQIPNTNPKNLINNIISNIKYYEYLVNQDGKEKADEKYENIGQLINIASKFEVQDQNGQEILEQFLEEISLMSDTEEDEEGTENSVKLMSIHGSKGLEFPVIMLAGLEENIFPLQKAKFNDKEMEEERRLMYVAITRAKDLLFFSYANFRMKRGQLFFNKPSRFLEEIPDELINHYDLSGNQSYSSVSNINEGDRIKHKLFGQGDVLEIANNTAMIKFDNPKYGIRKMDTKFLEKI
ncbi:ATP-dependent helicase [Candidatus Absconditicoccus praedator]|uniref:ATP-dependent helicase n=1 Tax=Candidatus Absconditicoccus praedator TaxID=2735562 RepID=UPI001E28883C|nr:UvrD-helicase domain-containing protein [Candidatus Absconditicoccus praedator]UFX83512.1 UvrD-helicase domain-containing protein [Candidatus Absconditicoccus praedator]